MGYRESLEQVQQMRLQQKLSPSQVRFVKMLEMTGPEIEDQVRHEIEDNPALERVDEMPATEDNSGESAEEMRLADYARDDIPTYRLEARNHSADDRYLEPVVVARANLMDYLMEQLRHSVTDKEIIEIAPYIIGNFDRNGYLRRSTTAIADDIAMDTGVDLDPRDIDKTLQAIRALDPAGIGATDLRDCLLLQLRRRPKDKATELAIDIVENHFDTFSRMHFDRLAAALGVDREQLKEGVEVIRSLNPKPAAAFDSGDDDVSRTIIPDFNVDVDGSVITLSLNNNIPELRVEATFAPDAKLPDAADSSRRRANAFITERRDRAEEFIRLLKQRQQTLFRVMSAIIKIQHDFFLTDDPARLKPMVLKDVAALTGYDLSVISRATAGKYVATRSGIYPVKFFFNESVTGDDSPDEATSTHAVMAALSEIIEAEDKRHPLSDMALVEQLKEKGIAIARRTVSKYRERLGFPVARLRRHI